jgi:chromate transporter
MTLLTLYLLLLKATLTSFSGGTSLPTVRQDFVLDNRVLTDHQLSTAIAISRMGPGPNGAYLIVIGNTVAGPAGAAAGYLAMITPAFLAIAFLKLLEGRTNHPRARAAIDGLAAAAAGLMLANGFPIAQSALTSWPAYALAAAALAAFLTRKLETFFILSAAALAGVALVYSQMHA